MTSEILQISAGNFSLVEDPVEGQVVLAIQPTLMPDLTLSPIPSLTLFPIPSSTLKLDLAPKFHPALTLGPALLLDLVPKACPDPSFDPV